MIYRFTYQHRILGVIVAADIEGAADIDVEHDGCWTIDGIRLNEVGGDRSVILPDDHPLCSDIKLWLLQSQLDEIDEAVGETLPFDDQYAEHRHSVREMV